MRNKKVTDNKGKKYRNAIRNIGYGIRTYEHISAEWISNVMYVSTGQELIDFQN